MPLTLETIEARLNYTKKAFASKYSLCMTDDANYTASEVVKLIQEFHTKSNKYEAEVIRHPILPPGYREDVIKVILSHWITKGFARKYNLSKGTVRKWH